MKFSRRWLWLLLLAPIALGLARLRFDVEVLNLLPENSSVVEGLKIYQQNFSNGRELIITVRSDDSEKTQTAARAIAVALREKTNLVSSATWQPPWLEHPQQSAELVAFLWLNQPPNVFAQLTNRLALKNLPANLAETKEQLATSLSPNEIAMRSYDPLGLMLLPESISAASPLGAGEELFASRNGKFRLIFVESKPDLASYRDCLQWLNEIKFTITNAQTSAEFPEGIQIHYTGRPAFVAEIAGGMEHDMTSSVGGTMVIIAILFGIAHRRFRPLIWILVLLALILGGTMALGGLFFGTINVVSMGFAAILLGLGVDYGLVLYQEAQAAPHLTAQQIRREMYPSILWSAVTTAGAFAILNLSGLPGLGQLGSLVALGVVLAAVVMLSFYLPPLKRAAELHSAGSQSFQSAETNSTARRKTAESNSAARFLWIATALIFFAAIFILWKKSPPFDHSPDALRPQNSPAYAAVEEIKIALDQKQEPLWILASGKNETEVAQTLQRAEAELNSAVSNQLISGFTLPTMLWARPQNQSGNKFALEKFLPQKERIFKAVLDSGFTSNSLALSEKLFESWEKALAQTNVFWPTNDASRWVLDNVVARTSSNYIAAGLVYASTNSAGEMDSAKIKQFAAKFSAVSPENDPRSEFRAPSLILSGWPLLGATMFDLVKKDFPRVLGPMFALLIFSLWLAFRRTSEVLLSLATLIFSGLCLFALMSLANWSWNLLNLMALPLLLGAGVDYSIHVQLALRRHHGNIREVRRSIGRALWLCGGTTIAGFGSLAWSNNAGLSSLGKVCATGIATTMLTSIYLLPVWWRQASRGSKVEGQEPSSLQRSASSFYQSSFWKIGLALARNFPQRISQTLCRSAASFYWRFNSTRREIVIQNLLVPLKGNRAKAIRFSKKLFQQFAIKLVDLWRYESGLPIDNLICEMTGWEHFLAAEKQKRGVLILTPHLGNWEFGAPLLAKKGFKLLVVTLNEPDERLTEMRQAARAKWGIETLVIGKDPFAFVEIIRRLEAGATVALLVDRPPANSAMSVELFGKTFSASVAAAELARASGCVLLPVYLPRLKNGYAAHILPEISYNRAELRGVEARRKLTQEIMNVFEKPIQENLDQWYHFIPIWPEPGE
jgi:predicted RND superfamily exporter protein/lauroyl/myristoyl acyltransferase